MAHKDSLLVELLIIKIPEYLKQWGGHVNHDER